MGQTNKKKGLFARIKEVSDIIAAVTVIGAAAVGCGTWAVSQIVAGTTNEISALSEKIVAIELDTTRAQLLMLMSNYPDDEAEILKVAKHYFKTLGGDWYMTNLFTKWAERHGIDVDAIINVSGDK